jgi:hypothetical protein
MKRSGTSPGRCPTTSATKEAGEELAEKPAFRVGGDDQVDRVQMDHQAEQVQIERPERQIEDRADEHRRDRPRAPVGRSRGVDRDDHPEAATRKPTSMNGLRQLGRLVGVVSSMARERAQELPENPALGIGRDHQVNLVEVHHQPE